MIVPTYAEMLVLAAAVYWVLASILLRCFGVGAAVLKANRELWISVTWGIANLGVLTIYRSCGANMSRPIMLFVVFASACQWLLALFLLWRLFWRSTAMVFAFPFALMRAGKEKAAGEAATIDSSILNWESREKTKVFVLLALLLSLAPAGFILVCVMCLHVH